MLLRKVHVKSQYLLMLIEPEILSNIKPALFYVSHSLDVSCAVIWPWRMRNDHYFVGWASPWPHQLLYTHVYYNTEHNGFSQSIAPHLPPNMVDVTSNTSIYHASRFSLLVYSVHVLHKCTRYKQTILRSDYCNNRRDAPAFIGHTETLTVVTWLGRFRTLSLERQSAHGVLIQNVRNGGQFWWWRFTQRRVPHLEQETAIVYDTCTYSVCDIKQNRPWTEWSEKKKPGRGRGGGARGCRVVRAWQGVH